MHAGSTVGNQRTQFKRMANQIICRPARARPGALDRAITGHIHIATPIHPSRGALDVAQPHTHMFSQSKRTFALNTCQVSSQTFQALILPTPSAAWCACLCTPPLTARRRYTMGKTKTEHASEALDESTVEDGRNYDELVLRVAPIAKPLASKKLTKKLYKVRTSHQT